MTTKKVHPIKRMVVGLYERIILWPVVQKPVITISNTMAATGKGTDRALKAGYLPVPVHFYSAIPDLADLKERDVWNKKGDLSGVDFDEQGQLALLAQLGQQFGEECRWPHDETEDVRQYYTHNPSFSFGCAASTYAMIRHFKPKRIIEIGSGMSSRVIAQALEKNAGGAEKAEYTIIDPFPRLEIADGRVPSSRLIKERVELTDYAIFETLEKNDILFIDSSHSLKIGSDVYALYLEILPRIAPGVVVHIHDIQLPYEYPEAYALNEIFRQFWTEQYPLQSFLAFNESFKVLLGMQYVIRDHKEAFAKAFPGYDTDDAAISGSFWMQRVK